MKRVAAIIGTILWIAVLYFVNLSPPSQGELLVDIGVGDAPTQVVEPIPWKGEPLVLKYEAPIEAPPHPSTL